MVIHFHRVLISGLLIGLLGGCATMLAVLWSAAILQPWLAAKTGIVLNDDARTAQSEVLITPLAGSPQAQLIRHDGSVAHQWLLEGSVAGMSRVLPDGSLMFITAAPSAKGKTPGPGGAAGRLEQVSWDNRVEWTYDDPLLHHDFNVLPDGKIAYLRWVPLSDKVGAQIQGGQPGTEFNGRVWGDQIVELDRLTGKTKVIFDVSKQLDPETHPIPIWERRAEWTHANGLSYIPVDPFKGEEAYLISFRQISTVLMVSRRTGDILWQYGGQWVLDQQHDPSYLPNGHVLLFDNGQYRLAQPSGSRVLEIDPLTNNVVWQFGSSQVGGADFYSAIIGGAQRLTNGNTLITLGTSGRVIGVTQDGKVVWDYHDPNGQLIFKARSYLPSQISPPAQ